MLYDTSFLHTFLEVSFVNDLWLEGFFSFGFYPSIQLLLLNEALEHFELNLYPIKCYLCVTISVLLPPPSFNLLLCYTIFPALLTHLFHPIHFLSFSTLPLAQGRSSLWMTSKCCLVVWLLDRHWFCSMEDTAEETDQWEECEVKRSTFLSPRTSRLHGFSPAVQSTACVGVPWPSSCYPLRI